MTSLMLALLVAQAALPLHVLAGYTPLASAARGAPPRLEAEIRGEATRFAPLVFARAAGQRRYSGYPMSPRGKGRWSARLPASLTAGASFEYFIEFRSDQGENESYGSPDQPFMVQVIEAEIKPARFAVKTEAPGATVLLDGKEVGKAPLEFEAPAGRHLVSIVSEDGRGAEQGADAVPGKTRNIFLSLPPAGGPGTLSLQSEPAGARLTLDGKPLGATPFVGETVPGDHALIIERQGFLRQERQVSWRAGHDVDLSFSLFPLPQEPSLALESTPPGALVFIDGAQKGPTPWVGVLAPGRHQALLRLAGRREVASDFQMPDGRDLSLRLDLPPAARSAPHVILTSKPAGAAIAIDGGSPVLTPWSGDLAPGKHQLEASLPGYLPETREVEARANRDQEVSFALEREKGPAQVSVLTEPPGAEVSVDGTAAGTTPLDKPLELAPGEHQILARRAGFKSVAQAVTVDQGQELSLRFTLAKADPQAQAPIIGVATIPEGAALFIDGKLAGTTPVKARSTPGPHELKVALDGYVTRSSKLSVPEGRDFELRVAVSLQRLRGSDEVSAPDARALARAELKRAQGCYSAHDWACALAGFQAAYDYKKVPDLLFNIAQARRRKGDLKEAGAAYRAYLEASPGGHLARQAQELAERCERAAAAGSLSVAEEDSTPPILVHEVLARAVRGEDLRIAARISDDQSGVFNPQVCWRNLFATDFECAALAPAGGDAYAFAIPARAVADGFAYYLEAFDNAGNGPARSGDPKSPHAVSLEEKGAPPERPAAATGPAATVACAPPPAPPAPPVDRWSLVVDAGAEHAFERYTDGGFGGRAGLGLSRTIGGFQFARARVDARFSSQPYRSFQPTPGAPASASGFSEQRYSAAAEYGVDLAALFLHSDRLQLIPLAAITWQRWQNAAFPADYAGPGGELRARFALLRGLAVSGGAGYSWNLLAHGGVLSAVGAPRSDTWFDAGLSLAVAGNHSIELIYRGDLLAVANDYRVSNGLTVGFGSTF